MTSTHDIAMIAAVGPNLELGSAGDLVWHISADLKNFKALTSGHPVIMGRNTWESLPKRPLPGRRNIVLSRGHQPCEGALLVHTPQEAIELCDGDNTPFVIGGQQIYELFLPLATTLYITHVDAKATTQIDAWFPEYRHNWRLSEASDWVIDPNGIKYRFEKWIRI